MDFFFLLMDKMSGLVRATDLILYLLIPPSGLSIPLLLWCTLFLSFKPTRHWDFLHCSVIGFSEFKEYPVPCWLGMHETPMFTIQEVPAWSNSAPPQVLSSYSSSSFPDVSSNPCWVFLRDDTLLPASCLVYTSPLIATPRRPSYPKLFSKRCSSSGRPEKVMDYRRRLGLFPLEKPWRMALSSYISFWHPEEDLAWLSL